MRKGTVNEMRKMTGLEGMGPRNDFKITRFAYRGATFRNFLRDDCRTVHNFPTFKVKLKDLLA